MREVPGIKSNYDEDGTNREEAGALAFALDVHGNEKDVRQGPYTGQDADATARVGVGGRGDGSRVGQEEAGVAASRPVGEGSDGVSSGMSVLSGYQLCRGQKGWSSR